MVRNVELFLSKLLISILSSFSYMNKKTRIGLEVIVAGLIALGTAALLDTGARITRQARAAISLTSNGGCALSDQDAQQLLKDIGYDTIEPNFDISKVTKAIWLDRTGVAGDPPLTLGIMDYVYPDYELMFYDSAGNSRSISSSEKKPKNGSIDNYCIVVRNANDKQQRFLVWDAKCIMNGNETDITATEAETRKVAQAFYNVSSAKFGYESLRWVKFSLQNIRYNIDKIRGKP